MGVDSHLSRKSDGSAVDVDHAVGKIVSVLGESHADALCWGMRLAGRVVGTQFRVFADETCFAGDRLVALDFALPARIAGLDTVSSRSCLEPSAEVLACVLAAAATASLQHYAAAERAPCCNGRVRVAATTQPAAGQQTRQWVPPHNLSHPISFLLLAYLVLARLPLPPQDFVNVGARRNVLSVVSRRVRLLLRFAFVHGGSARTIQLVR